MNCTDNACCISHLFSRFSCKALAFLSSLRSHIDWPASVVATVFFFQLLIFHFLAFRFNSSFPYFALVPLSSFFVIFRARGERALITYTIEAIRDMSTEILRTEKDMATHKKYVQLFCLFAIIYIWLYILHYYDIECVVSEVWRRLYLSCLDTSSHCHLTQCVCSVSPQIRQA